MTTQTFNFARLARMAGGEDSIDQIKSDLPISFVLAKHGIEVRKVGSVLKAHCPWHDDSDPSLDVKVGDGGYERAFCSPCGWHGDVLDVIQRLNSCDLKQAIKIGFEHLDAGVEMDGILKAAEQPEIDVDALKERFRQAYEQHDPSSLAKFLRDKDLDIDEEWLHAEFWISTPPGGKVFIPIADVDRSVVGYKYRNGLDQTLTARGTRLRNWYGVWRDTDADKPVVLCEGESDTWVAAWHLSSLGYAVLGLPAGAGSNAPIEHLSGRVVVLAFDGDPAGRQAALRWANRLHGNAEEVRVAAIPDGRDLATLADPTSVIVGARKVSPALAGLDVEGESFVRPGRDDTQPLSNWRLEPERVLEGDGEVAYEGVLHPLGERAVITAREMSSDGTLIKWTGKYGLSWLGTKRDTQNLLAWFNNQRPFLSPGRAATQVGLFEDVIVTPSGYIGEHRVTYIPKRPTPIHCRVEPNDDWKGAFDLALNLHRPEVVTPILAWLAAAPLRTKFLAFPFLNVAGLSGTGKTTLTERLVSLGLGVYASAALTGTTPFAVEAMIDGSNGFPVWFDEYRHGARSETMRLVSQILRAAYTQEVATRGFVGKQGLEVSEYRTDAPIILTGEEYLGERSHFDRAISVLLPPDGRNEKALVALQGSNGWAFEYLHWLADRLAHKQLAPVPVTGEGPEDLPERMRNNISVLKYGWRLLIEFNPYLREDMLDLSLVFDTMQQSDAEDPTLEALRWALAQPAPLDGSVVVEKVGDTIHVNTTNFVRAVRDTDFTLPGKSKHVAHFLQSHFGARQERMGASDNRYRVWVFDADMLVD